MKKVILKITGMDCVSCAINIDGQLEDTEGVKEAITNYAKQQTEVTYDETKIDSKKLTVIVKQAGYSSSALE